MAESILSDLKSKGLTLDGLQEQLSSVLSEEAKNKLSNIFERYQSLNDEEKDEFLDTVFGKIQRAMHEKLEEANPYTYLLYTHSHIVFLFAVLLITLVIVFFVYKLFKCLTEREMKREEKKKQKQLKKKK
ncbi:uncharacterized protein LOC116426873 isoform X2 [Nomia melanderi]|uniref:uncharacterized protein LOC116426873 isoform X2 n=1 Tax=Nomia melanderi TaxID=2448451 RepID=UPI0013046176|nr:uncharacterized protein LOC116426873 isoform X2 [Nomia melanderi]